MSSIMIWWFWCNVLSPYLFCTQEWIFPLEKIFLPRSIWPSKMNPPPLYPIPKIEKTNKYLKSKTKTRIKIIYKKEMGISLYGQLLQSHHCRQLSGNTEGEGDGEDPFTDNNTWSNHSERRLIFIERSEFFPK